MQYGEFTKNIFLNKPADEDKVLVKDLNENSDILDKLLQQITITLYTKADITDPNFFGTPIAPDINNPNTSSQIATINSIISMLNIKNIVVYNSKNDFPDIGDENNLYILKNENNYSEHLWNGSRYVPDLA